MARNRQRVCLESGAKLDINRLLRDGTIPRNGGGILRVGFADGSQQEIALTSQPRHFGGRQWYFRCPRTGRLASVLWRPPGARWFASRQAWGRRVVAYESQVQDATGRAHLGQRRVKRRLIGNLDPEEWDFPPKPKWMRWKTYERYEARFHRYEEILNYGCFELALKLGLKIVSRAFFTDFALDAAPGSASSWFSRRDDKSTGRTSSGGHWERRIALKAKTRSAYVRPNKNSIRPSPATTITITTDSVSGMPLRLVTGSVVF